MPRGRLGPWRRRCSTCAMRAVTRPRSGWAGARSAASGGRSRRRSPRAAPCAPRRSRHRTASEPPPSQRSIAGWRRPGRPTSPNSTVCWAAAWCRGRSCCSPVEPGVGKSTLLLEVGSWTARQGTRVLYVTGEESATPKCGSGPNASTPCRRPSTSPRRRTWGSCSAPSTSSQPDLIIIDSVQTLASADVDGAPGGVAQVREVAAAVIRAAKDHAIPTVLVGHVTKDGSVAGPRTLEHLVDVVCSFEGERHSRLRMLRAVKNRYGPTDEVGCFDMTESGIESLPRSSGLFLTRSATRAPGSCLTVALEGRRPMLIEVQSLIDDAHSHPRRTVSGLDSNRIAMILAVLGRLTKTADKDVFSATVGGMRVSETACDLALALSLASARTGDALYSRLVAIGEISLSGEIRPVPGLGSAAVRSGSPGRHESDRRRRIARQRARSGRHARRRMREPRRRPSPLPCRRPLCPPETRLTPKASPQPRPRLRLHPHPRRRRPHRRHLPRPRLLRRQHRHRRRGRPSRHPRGRP